MLNEVNPPALAVADGIGVMDPAPWQHTVDVPIAAGIIAAAPALRRLPRPTSPQAALDDLAAVDTTGEPS